MVIDEQVASWLLACAHGGLRGWAKARRRCRRRRQGDVLHVPRRSNVWLRDTVGWPQRLRPHCRGDRGMQECKEPDIGHNRHQWGSPGWRGAHEKCGLAKPQQRPHKEQLWQSNQAPRANAGPAHWALLARYCQATTHDITRSSGASREVLTSFVQHGQFVLRVTNDVFPVWDTYLGWLKDGRNNSHWVWPSKERFVALHVTFDVFQRTCWFKTSRNPSGHGQSVWTPPFQKWPDHHIFHAESTHIQLKLAKTTNY